MADDKFMADAQARDRAVRIALNVLRVAESKGKPVGPVVEMLEESLRARHMPQVLSRNIGPEDLRVLDEWAKAVNYIGTVIQPEGDAVTGKAGVRYYAAGIARGWSIVPVGGAPSLYEQDRKHGLMWSPTFIVKPGTSSRSNGGE